MLKLHEVSTFSMAICWQSPSNDELRLKISKVGTSKVSIKSWTLTASTGGRRCWKLDCSNGAGPASKNCISRTPIKKHLSLDKLVNRACRSSTFKWFWSESSMSTCNAMTGGAFRERALEMLQDAVMVIFGTKIQEGLSRQAAERAAATTRKAVVNPPSRSRFRPRGPLHRSKPHLFSHCLYEYRKLRCVCVLVTFCSRNVRVYVNMCRYMPSLSLKHNVFYIYIYIYVIHTYIIYIYIYMRVCFIIYICACIAQANLISWLQHTSAKIVPNAQPSELANCWYH